MSKARSLADLGNVYDDGALSHRNMLINGSQIVSQRGTSFTSQNGSHFVTDRFEPTLNSYGVWTTEQSSDAPDGFSKSLKMTCTTADASPSSTDYCRISYQVEGQDLQHLNFGSSAAKTTTISFWVKSNEVATYVFWMYQPDNANTRQINKLFTVDTADTWEYKTITIEGDVSGTINNDTGSGMILGWVLSSGTGYTSGTRPSVWTDHTAADRWAGLTADVGGTVNNYFQITGVQWELGDTATPFEHRSYGDELARCQRYYQKSGVFYNYCAFNYNNRAYANIPLPVKMRSAPSVVDNSIGPWYQAGTSYTYSTVHAAGYVDSVEMSGNISGGANGGAGTFYPAFTADAEL